MRTTLNCPALFIKHGIYGHKDVSSIRLHNLDGIAHTKLITLFYLCISSLINMIYNTQINALTDIRIAVIDLSFLCWFSKIKSGCKLTIGTS